MPFAPATLLAITAAYLLGAVPFGLLVARTRGVDIRTVGSGNIGATNVWRCVGKTWGALVYALDMAKGIIAVAVIPKLLAGLTGDDSGLTIRLACGLFAVVGHNWPVYLRFKGGKGIATTAGVLLGIAPAAMGIGIVTWILVFVTGRYVSLASIVAAVVVGASGWFLYYESNMLCGALTLLAVFAIWRHHANIGRLINGNEHRFTFGKKDASP
jgi:glycerol-3-phosphate acyltransferase PlsY